MSSFDDAVFINGLLTHESATSSEESSDSDSESVAIVQHHYSKNTSDVSLKMISAIEMRDIQESCQRGNGIDIICKIVLFGETGVGKTQFALALTRPRTETMKTLSHSISTIGVDFACHYYLVGGADCFKAQVWDTAGQERFACTPSTYARNADVIVVFFDTTMPASFQSIGRRWLPDIEDAKRANPGLTVVLIGTKIDLVEKRAIGRAVGEQWVEVNQFDAYAEISNLSRLSVHETFEHIVRCAYRKRPHQRQHVVLPQMPAKQRSRCCGGGGEKKSSGIDLL